MIDYEKEMALWEEEEEDTVLNLYVSNNIICSIYATQCNQSFRRGSIPGHIVINREREKGHDKLWNDYFSENPTFGARTFRRRF